MCLYMRAGQNVVFIRQPQDIKAVSGNDAFFPCTYTGTRGAPHWSVNQTRTYTVSALPSGHSHNDTGLIVHSVDTSMNATKYQCCFEFHVGQGVIKPVCSSAGMLIIITTGQKFFCLFLHQIFVTLKWVATASHLNTTLHEIGGPHILHCPVYCVTV